MTTQMSTWSVVGAVKIDSGAVEKPGPFRNKGEKEKPRTTSFENRLGLIVLLVSLVNLEFETQSKLHHARIVDGFVNLSKVSAVDVLHEDAVPDQPQLSMVEEVEDF
jgi:hypothetical protein